MQESSYLHLKLSLALFKKPPRALSQKESAHLLKVAKRQKHMEAMILASHEAAGVVLSEAVQAARLQEIRARYPEREEFLTDLSRNGLDESELEEAIARDLRVEIVLEKIAAQVPEVSREEAWEYYQQHPAAFLRPEMRHMRHILITHQDAAQKKAARMLLETLCAQIKTKEDFAAAALKYSQCPTALQEGVIGTVKRGQLFPELEGAAFALSAGELSLPLDSPIGVHLLFCDAIFPAMSLEFEPVKERIVAHLTNERRQAYQRAWIRAQQKAAKGKGMG